MPKKITLREMSEPRFAEICARLDITINANSILWLRDTEKVDQANMDEVTEEISRRYPDRLLILICRSVIDLDPPLAVFEVQIDTATAQWCESFGTLDQVNAFLRGVSAAASFSNLGLMPLPRVSFSPHI